MKSVWREYGVIGTLLVVAIGGYLFMSRNDMDVLNASIQTIGNHLLSLVPEARGRSGVEAALDTLRQRVAKGEVQPEEVERFAASVFNIGTAGAELDPEDAELVVRMAYSDQAALPQSDVAPSRPPPPPKKTVSRSDLAKLAVTLEPMVAFFETVRSDPAPDSSGPAYRFYSDGKLHVVVDDRARPQVEQVGEAQKLIQEKAMSWRAHFAEAVEAERERNSEKARTIVRIAGGVPDTLHIHRTAETLARLHRLRSLGLVSDAWVDSVVIEVETALESFVRELPPPKPSQATGGASVSSSGSSSGR